jgi:predicted RecA/RadA family phage recombinase
MNKAVTDGIDFMPSPFIDGLDVWSRGDGTPAAPTYDGAGDAVFVADDPDFRGCLELTKTEATQRLRYTGETPILPGCYVRIRVRLKVVSGDLPGVRIAAWAGRANGTHLDGVAEYGPTVQIGRLDDIVTIEGYAGTGARSGVDMPWGTEAAYGHFGIDLTGPNGAVIRIDDIEIADGTSAFLRDMMDVVDIRDYGAIGDGFTDDTAALEAADAAAAGRIVLVPEGIYRIESSVSIAAPIRFHGRLSMPDDAMLLLLKSFDLPTYIEAFGDEEVAFRKALQALFNFTDHESLDMGGRRVQVNGPIDVAAAVANKATFETRRVLRNGQLDAQESAAWDPAVVTQQSSYDPQDPLWLTDIAAPESILPGALVTGNGVGREVYVRSVDAAGGRVELSAPLYGAAGSQSYNFTRFRYLLDFSGFSKFSKFVIESVELKGNGVASGILLAPEGRAFQMRDCQVNKPRDRVITSPGRGCQGMLIDRNQFLSDEQQTAAQDRVSMVLNVNANDVKLRNNRATRFRHFAVLGGDGHLVLGNHWFQGDDETGGVRTGGVIFTQPNVRSVINGNYIDNSTIEWTNEHDAAPEFSDEFSFGGLTVIGNTFVVKSVLPSFRWLSITPHGPGHFLHGLNISGNTLRTLSGNIDRIETVNDSFAGLDPLRARNITIAGNTFNGVDAFLANPVSVAFAVATPQTVWTCDFGSRLAFGLRARVVEAVVPEGAIVDASGEPVFALPQVATGRGAQGQAVELRWPVAVSGTIRVVARVDNPE